MPPILAHQIAARRVTNWEMGWEGMLMAEMQVFSF